MTLFAVNGVDFTSHVVEKSYSVQQQDVYESWIDGNWINHRVIARQQVTGSFNMTFSTEDQYSDFKSTVDSVKNASGYCPVTVWVNNIKATAAINAFVEITTKHRWTTPAFGGDPELAAVTIKITER